MNTDVPECQCTSAPPPRPFSVEFELLQTRQGSACKIVRFEKIYAAVLAVFTSWAKVGPAKASARVTAKIEIRVFMAFFSHYVELELKAPAL